VLQRLRQEEDKEALLYLRLQERKRFGGGLPFIGRFVVMRLMFLVEL